MRGIAIALGLAACNSGPDSRPDSRPITGCTACGSGAIIDGIFVPNENDVVAVGSSGVIAYGGGNLTWVGSDFTAIDSTSLDVAPSAAPDSGRIITSISGDVSNAVYVGLRTQDDIDDYGSVIGFAADHHQLFRIELGYSDNVAVASSAGLVVYANASTLNINAPSLMTAVHASDGSMAWTTGMNLADGRPVLAAAPDGTIVLGGDFQALALNGGMNAVAGTVIAAYDPATGIAKWAVQISGKADVSAIATGPGGEVAVALLPFGQAITIGSQTVPPTDGSVVALFDPTGALRWAQSVPGPTALATDGTVVESVAPGGFAQLSASGVDWSVPFGGAGAHLQSTLALSGSTMLASISTLAGSDGDASLIDGDVTVSGEGTVIANVAR